jgi:hypothetical protein
MELKLHLAPASSIPYNYYIRPHRPPRSDRFPNLYFSGTSLGLRGNEEVPVHGSVNMSDDGVVRWRFVSWVSTLMLEALLIANSKGIYLSWLSKVELRRCTSWQCWKCSWTYWCMDRCHT